MENKLDEPEFNAPIPGMGLTHEVGARPWQSPPQHTTVEEALDFYVPRLTSKEFVDKLISVIASSKLGDIKEAIDEAIEEPKEEIEEDIPSGLMSRRV
mgnify:CR=1 FL=1